MQHLALVGIFIFDEACVLVSMANEKTTRAEEASHPTKLQGVGGPKCVDWISLATTATVECVQL